MSPTTPNAAPEAVDIQESLVEANKYIQGLFNSNLQTKSSEVVDAALDSLLKQGRLSQEEHAALQLMIMMDKTEVAATSHDQALDKVIVVLTRLKANTVYNLPEDAITVIDSIAESLQEAKVGDLYEPGE